MAEVVASALVRDVLVRAGMAAVTGDRWKGQLLAKPVTSGCRARIIRKEPVPGPGDVKMEIWGRMSVAALFCKSKNLGTISKHISRRMDT